MVVALFEIHIESTAPATMKPPTIPAGLVPPRLTMFRAILLCNCHRSTDVAMMKPPRSINTIGLEYGLAATAIGITPEIGKITSGNIAVTGIGIASVTHHVAIRTTNDTTIQEWASRPSGIGNSWSAIATDGPSHRPIDPTVKPALPSLEGLFKIVRLLRN